MYLFSAQAAVSHPNSLIPILLTSCLTAYPWAMVIYTPSAYTGAAGQIVLLTENAQ